MSSQFDQIANDYDQCLTTILYREYMEIHSAFKLFGDMKGLSVLDVACGTGFYTRAIRNLGALKVVGVDISEGMVEVACAIEKENPLDIEYIGGDIASIRELGLFDCVTAIYLLHYATSKKHLFEMCNNIARNVKSGGRFITFVINPGIVTAPDYYKAYNFTIQANEHLVDGDTIKFMSVIGGELTEVLSHYWSKTTLETALTEAGFTDIRWIKAEVSEAGIEKYGSEIWQNYLNSPHCIFIECIRL